MGNILLPRPPLFAYPRLLTQAGLRRLDEWLRLRGRRNPGTFSPHQCKAVRKNFCSATRTAEISNCPPTTNPPVFLYTTPLNPRSPSSYPFTPQKQTTNRSLPLDLHCFGALRKRKSSLENHWFFSKIKEASNLVKKKFFLFFLGKVY